MSLILRQVIGYQQGRRAVSSTTPSHELTQTKNQLNSILNKWKFGDTPIKTSEEFLNNFEPWINQKIAQAKELKLFLAKKGVNDLKEAETKLTNRDLSESAELDQLREELTNKDQEVRSKEQELTQLQETWNNTETDYLRRIEELRTSQASSELPEDYEDLITEKDELARDKKTLEQANLALNNQFRNKHQELQNKEKALNKKLKEIKTDLEKHQKNYQELKEKYTKKTKQLDEEQLNGNKLEEKIASLERKITQLETERRNLLEPQKTYQEWLSSGTLNERITEGSWSGYTYTYAAERDHSGFQDDPTNLTKKWKLEDLKEEIENNLPY